LQGPNSDTVLELYAEDGVTLLARNDDDLIDGGPASRIDVEATAGVYFVRVMQARPADVWGCAYSYYVSVVEGTPTPTVERWHVSLPIIVLN
jgi:hypothetical protein